MNKSEFNKHVQKEFTFLEKEYGYKYIKSDSDYLQFESDKVFIIISYDSQRSFEINFIIGLMADKYDNIQKSFELSQIIRYLNKTNNNQAVQSDNIDEIQSLIIKLALTVKKYLPNFLLGKIDSYISLSKYLDMESKNYLLSIQLSDVRKSAKKAWDLKKYADVIKLYESICEHLKPSENKKLNYARKQQD